MKIVTPKITITFLGTGTSTGVPMITSQHPVAKSTSSKDKRLRSSILVSWNDENFAVDCGPDFRQQMLRENVQTLKGVFITHEHTDHVGGLDDIRPYGFQIGEVPIYVLKRVLDNISRRFDYIFSEENRYPSAPRVQPFVISHQKNIVVNGLEVIPIEVMHGDLPILGYRFGDIAYLTDIKSIAETEKKKLQNVSILIVTGLRIEEHRTHFNLEESLRFIEEIQPKKTYLTHISELLGFHEEVSKNLPKNIFLAYDGLKLDD